MFHKKFWFDVLVLLGLALIGGCGSDDGSVVDPPPEEDGTLGATIGPDGGILEIEGAFRLTVPEGALSESIEFTVAVNDTLLPITAPYCFMSGCYMVEPSGTVFDSAVELSLVYAESLMVGGAVEDSMTLFICVDSSWTPLVTTVDVSSNTVTAEIGHLSDFVVAADTTWPPVQAELHVVRSLTRSGETAADTLEMIWAKFEGSVPTVAPIHPDSVRCNEYPLVLDENTGLYGYTGTDVIELDSTYTFYVFGNSSLPDLEAALVFPNRQPDITAPIYPDMVPRSGFTVEWTGSGGGGQVRLLLGDSAGVVVDIMVPNTGSYEITEEDYSRLPGPEVELSLTLENLSAISVEGYTSESFVAARAMSRSSFYLEF